MQITVGGKTFEVACEMVDVTSISRPDEHWQHTDSAGHVHRWLFDGKPGGPYSPRAKTTIPTLRYVVDEVYWCADCNDEHERGHHECVTCGEHVNPGTCADDFRQFVPGLICYWIDGRSVPKDEFYRVYKETAGVDLEAQYGDRQTPSTGRPDKEKGKDHTS